MIQVIVSRVGRLDSSPTSCVVVLQEQGGVRVLPIWIGQSEAEAIVRHMHHVPVPRPLTHDLVRNVLVGLGARLRRVNITRVEDRTYYAELQLQLDDKLIRVDARPSDAIAIAIRLESPIYAAEDLLLKPGEFEDVEDERESAPEFGEAAEAAEPAEADELMTDAELTAEQLKRYLETLRPEDFGKFNP